VEAVSRLEAFQRRERVALFSHKIEKFNESIKTGTSYPDPADITAI
jgi:hypothetical protein